MRYAERVHPVLRCLDMINQGLASHNGVLNGPNDPIVRYPFGCKYGTIIACFNTTRAKTGVVRHVHRVILIASTRRRSMMKDHLASRMRRSQLAS